MHRADPRFFQPVSVRPIVLREEDGGKRTATISVSTAAAIATAMAPKVVERFPDGTTRIIAAPPEPPQPPFQDVALAVLDDDVVDKALAFYSHTDNWAVNLYKVYEIVGLDVEETRLSRKSTFNDDKGRFITNSWKEIARQGWTTEGEATRCSTTVHSPAVIGDQARHGVQTKPRPANPDDSWGWQPLSR
jgi:hypothetical protein